MSNDEVLEARRTAAVKSSISLGLVLTLVRRCHKAGFTAAASMIDVPILSAIRLPPSVMGKGFFFLYIPDSRVSQQGLEGVTFSSDHSENMLGHIVQQCFRTFAVLKTYFAGHFLLLLRSRFLFSSR